MNRIVIAVFIFFSAFRHAHADAPKVTERNGVQIIPAVKVNPAPVIDGVLDDTAWREAPSVSDFWCIDLNKLPTEPTTMWLAYDSRNLYFAFSCKDSQPDKIVAVETRRGGAVYRDDNVAILLDPRYRHQENDIFSFNVTARGTQTEYIAGGSALKIEWRGDWQAAARKVPDGYTVEVAIPIEMLRCPPGQDTIGVAAMRYHPRTLEYAWYSKMIGNYDITKMPAWTGLQLPAYRPPMRIMPYVLMETGDLRNRLRTGVDVKHTFASGLTGVFTALPDFQNIEGDVLDLDFSYSERLTREVRPFFVEGQQFFPSSQLFAPQRVGEMDAGIKLFGKTGRTSLGLLGVYDGSNHRATALRVEQEISPFLRVGGAYAGRFDDTAQSSAGQLSVDYQRLSRTGTATAHAHYASMFGRGDDTFYELGAGFFGVNGRLGGSLRYSHIGPDFNPADGFIPERDLNLISASLNYNKQTAGRVQTLYAALQGDTATHTDSSFFYNAVRFTTFVGFRDGSGFAITPSFVDRSENGILFRDRVLNVRYFWNRFKQYRQGSFSAAFGQQAGGSLLQFRLSQGLRLTERLLLNLSSEYRRGSVLDVGSNQTQRLIQRQTILSLNYDLTPERGMGGRLVQRDGHLNWYLSYRQNVRRGMDAFIILGDPNAQTFQPHLALKTVYVF